MAMGSVRKKKLRTFIAPLVIASMFVSSIVAYLAFRNSCLAYVLIISALALNLILLIEKDRRRKYNG